MAYTFFIIRSQVPSLGVRLVPLSNFTDQGFGAAYPVGGQFTYPVGLALVSIYVRPQPITSSDRSEEFNEIYPSSAVDLIF
ncbi:MAG: hypothetical protein MZV63_13155 [Marinilabiliales bacterium]|nr:hypothetical protein [Marinilabiliales bacterium]